MDDVVALFREHQRHTRTSEVYGLRGCLHQHEVVETGLQLGGKQVYARSSS